MYGGRGSDPWLKRGRGQCAYREEFECADYRSGPAGVVKRHSRFP